MKEKNILVKQLLIGGILLVPFIALYVISEFILKDYYLFEWTASHGYLFIWLLVFIFVFLKRYLLASTISAGNIVGILIGQFVGDIIQSENVKAVTENMTGEEIYRLQHHPGFEIWLTSILVAIVFVLFLQYFMRKKQK